MFKIKKKLNLPLFLVFSKTHAIIRVYTLLLLFPFLSYSQEKSNSDTELHVLSLLDSSNVMLKKNNIKALSYIKEASQYEHRVNDTIRLKFYSIAGYAYNTQHSNYIALNYFYKQLEMYNKLKPSLCFKSYSNIGGVFFEMGDYPKARKFYNLGINNLKKYGTSEKKIQGSLLYSNLAEIEAKEENHVKALTMLNEFLEYNIVSKDTLNMILGYENIGTIHDKLSDWKTAIKNFENGIKLASAVESDFDLASLYNKLGIAYFNYLPESDLALYYLQKSYDISSKNDFLKFELASSEKLVDLYEKRNNTEKALYYLHVAKSLSENSIKEENSKRATELEFDYNQRIQQQQIILKQNKKENYFIASIVLLLLFSVIIFLMFKLQRSRSKKRIIENELLAQQLEEKNKELTNNAIRMFKTKEFIQSTQKELNQLEIRDDKSASKKLLSKIIDDLKKGTQGFNEKEFEKILIETDGEFYKRLLKKVPNLSKNEIRLCTFLKMNLSSKEISGITQQSIHSIDVARSRLRKKLQLPPEASLTNYLVLL